MGIEVRSATGRWDDFASFMVPRKPGDGGGRIEQTSGYVGTIELFEAHGFRRVRQSTGRSGGKPRWLVRRDLP